MFSSKLLNGMFAKLKDTITKSEIQKKSLTRTEGRGQLRSGHARASRDDDDDGGI